jgi:hypothetical protein
MNSQPGLSLAARKWIVNAGLVALGIMAIFAIRDLWAGKVNKAGYLALPARLSCSQGAAPSVWEDGQLHFDFRNRVMATNGGRKRVYTADRVWNEDQDQFLSIVGFTDASNGRHVQMSDTIRVHLLSRSRSGAWDVNVSSAVHGNDELMRLSCLGMT